MVEGISASSNHNNGKTWALDLTGTNLFAWRVRAAPDIDADEIDVFHHGDRICAEQDASHPGWFKLLDKCGWVKDSHEGVRVWNIASSSEPDASANADLASTFDAASGDDECGKDGHFKKAKKLVDDDIEPAVSGASGSQSSSPHLTQTTTRALLPVFFSGSSYQLHETDAIPDVPLSSSMTRWFTGQCHKLSMPTEDKSSVQLSPPTAAKPRWADMEDTDEEGDEFLPRSVDKDFEAHVDAASVSTMDVEDIYPPSAEMIGKEVEKNRRQRRNRTLLERRNKTQLCRYIREPQACPFGAACWFAHDATEIEDKEKLIDSRDESGEALQAVETQIDKIPVSEVEAVIKRPNKLARNKELKKKRAKTQMCKHFTDEGFCQFADVCWFAHSIEELRVFNSAPTEEGITN